MPRLSQVNADTVGHMFMAGLILIDIIASVQMGVPVQTCGE